MFAFSIWKRRETQLLFSWDHSGCVGEACGPCFCAALHSKKPHPVTPFTLPDSSHASFFLPSFLVPPPPAIHTSTSDSSASYTTSCCCSFHPVFGVTCQILMILRAQNLKSSPRGHTPGSKMKLTAYLWRADSSCANAFLKVLEILTFVSLRNCFFSKVLWLRQLQWDSHHS